MAARRIEDVICDVLTDDAQRNALDFIAHLRAHDVPLPESEAYWDIAYKGRSLCFVWINGAEDAPGPWTIWSDQEPGSWASWPDVSGCHASVDERTKEVAWANVNFCASCGGDCSPGQRKTVLGRSFDGLCGSTMAFRNPDAEALACAKKMVDIRKEDILRTL